uniref:Phosphoinositide phospholipase C n=2 Tax=Neoaves TaxID=3078114 RepID=A0A663DSM1_AQUCH
MKDGSRQRPPQKKKTVSFSTMPNDRKINSTAACISFMLEGCELKKVRSNSRMYSRFFVLDADMRSVRWEPSKKDSEKAKIEIKSVKEVRVGKKTPVLRSNGLSDQFPDECAFSIIYGDNYESLDLVASSADVVSAWVMGLRYLVSYGKHTPEAPGTGHPSLRTSWISSVFDLADLEKSGRIPVSRAVQLIKALNPGMKTSTIELKFKELQKASERPGAEVACDLFVEVYCELCTRPEIFFLLVQFSSNKEYLGLKDLLMFLEVEQGMEGVTEEKCLEIVGKYEPSKEGREKGYLAIDGFTRYLLSADCSIFDPQHRKVCQDMAQPLSHYYISSAHSACLLEDNFWGRSDISGYISALGLGCRSIELVLWDGPEGEPVVYTSPSAASCVPFRAVVGLIDQHAFAASAYPLILCLVVRCSAAQQRLAAQCLRKTLGEKLYLEPPNPAASYLPSPEQLKGRILIKGKKLPPGCEDSEGEVSDEEEGWELARRLGQEDRETPEGGGPRRVRLSRELSELVSLCQAVPFQDFESSRRGQRYWEMCSFSEVEAGRFANECPAELVSYNKRFLSRVYPSPMRIDASNMNPQDFWKCGCQMVAMNYQTPGLMMDLNTGWFRQNGACGYVLRPAIMREEVSYFSANAKDSLPGVPAQLLHLKVISGQNLPKPKGSGAKGEVVEPYVCAEIHGIPADCAEHRTKTALQSGDNPVFDESLEFQINLPELAVLRFVVLDDDYIGDEFIAQYTIPFECLQPGYRHVPLQSLAGEPLPHATLFVHVAITDRRGGGKGHRRGLAGRRGRRVREYTSTKATGIKAIDEVFRTATQPLREATDLRENVQNALVSFKELCGLTPAANMKQCILTVAAWLLHSDSAPSVTLNLAEQYPPMEAQGPIPDLLRKVLTAYETMIQTSRTLIESADAVYGKLIQAQQAGMDFHKELHRIEAKEGLRGRKLQKALESFAWNITVLKVRGEGCAAPSPPRRPAPRGCSVSTGDGMDPFRGSRRCPHPASPHPGCWPVGQPMFRTGGPGIPSGTAPGPAPDALSPHRARLTFSSTPRLRRWTTCGRSTTRDSPAASAGMARPRRSPPGYAPRWSPSPRRKGAATRRPADPGLGLGGPDRALPCPRGPGPGSPSLLTDGQLPARRLSVHGGMCAGLGTRALSCRGAAAGTSGEVGEGCPCSCLPPPRPAPRASSIPPNICFWSKRPAAGPAWMLAPRCLHACTPSLLCQTPLVKVAPGLGSCSRPGPEVLPSPTLGKTCLAGRVLASPSPLSMGQRVPSPPWRAWGPCCAEGPGGSGVQLLGELGGGPLETGLGSRCGLWHQRNVGARPPGRGGPGTSNGRGAVWGQTGAVERYKECETHCGALLLPPRAWCGAKVGWGHQSGWRVARGTGTLAASSLPRHQLSAGRRLPTSRSRAAARHPFVQGSN